MLEFPSLYSSADALSRKGQRWQKGFFASSFCLNLIAAVLASLSRQTQLTLGFVWMCMVASVMLSMFLYLFRPEVEWFSGRALAESVKTLAWRYSTCAEPYDYGLPEREAEMALHTALLTMLREAQDIGSGLATPSGSKPQISQSMKKLRMSSLPDRREAYSIHRLQDQQSWYSSQARKNRRLDRVWSFAFVVCQFLALCAAAVAAIHGKTGPVYMVGILTTLAGSLVAWQQLCQFGALATAYGMTSQELASIQSTFSLCTTDKEFSEFVLSAEQAISREHTFWLARRRRP